MERLTKNIGDGIVVWAHKGTREDVLKRLAAYEDPGLEPEEIIVQRYLLHRYSEATDGLSLKRLDELNKAEKDGRLVVLPCKIGDTVWVLLEDGAPCMARVQGISMSATCEDILLRFGGYPPVSVWGSDIGKTWFLTRQEAEEALRKEETRQ